MTSPDEWWRLGVADLSRRLSARTLDAVDLVEACLARVARLDPALNSMVALDAEGAGAAARASARRWAAGAPLSPLDGIPITVKDNLLVRGLPATWGSRAFAGFVPEQDELPVARLRAAGAVIVGKTNVPELTLEGYTANLLFGTTRNPWDTRLTPGGSSGGAAAGVAAGLVPAAIGTDGGGSIRRPASHTGLVGFKPSTGRIPRCNGFTEILSDFEVIGTLTRSVDDACLLDAVLAGPDTRDRRSALPPAPPARSGPRRILAVTRFGEAPLDTEVEAAFAELLRWLAVQGHTVETGAMPFDKAEADDLWRIISRAGVARLFRQHGDALEREGGAFVRSLAAEGRAIAAANYVEALERIVAFRQQIAGVFEHYDLIVTPSAAALPWRADESHPAVIEGRPAGPRGHAVYTGWVNIAGHPGINMPIGFSAAGLPIGAQFIGAYAADVDLLAFAQAFETARKAPDRWPTLAEER